MFAKLVLVIIFLLMMLIFARDLFRIRLPRSQLCTRAKMASRIKAMFGSSSSSQKNQHSDPNLTARVQPHAHDPTLAWDRLKVKQIVKRFVKNWSRSQTLVPISTFHHIMCNTKIDRDNYMSLKNLSGACPECLYNWGCSVRNFRTHLYGEK